MNLTKITLTEQESFGASCFANERNEVDRQQHEHQLAEKNRLAREEHWKADRAAETQHNESQRAAADAHTGEEPYEFEAYVGEAFVEDETPFEPRSTEELCRVALNEILSMCAQRAHQSRLENLARGVMELSHDDRRKAIDAIAKTQK